MLGHLFIGHIKFFEGKFIRYQTVIPRKKYILVFLKEVCATDFCPSNNCGTEGVFSSERPQRGTTYHQMAQAQKSKAEPKNAQPQIHRDKCRLTTFPRRYKRMRCQQPVCSAVLQHPRLLHLSVQPRIRTEQ